MVIQSKYDAEIQDRFFYDGACLRYHISGEKAGTLSANGYLMVTVLGKQLYVHRICWFLVYREWPTKNIDHINGDKTDNNMSNLREATHSQNGCNRLNSANKSGRKNVYWSNTRNRWVIDITLNRVRVFHKVVEDYDEAVALAKAKMDELHGEFARYE
jgi:hypothetical protein